MKWEKGNAILLRREPIEWFGKGINEKSMSRRSGSRNFSLPEIDGMQAEDGVSVRLPRLNSQSVSVFRYVSVVEQCFHRNIYRYPRP